MSLKRYSPKYKKHLRFRYPLLIEKRIKIRNFLKKKWRRAVKKYYSRRLKFFKYDISASAMSRNYRTEKYVWKKKIYKQILIDKLRLQTYYGNGKLRFFQLKNLARKAKASRGKERLTPGKSVIFLFENRLDVVLYRLSLTQSISQARKLIQDNRVNVGFNSTTNPSYLLKTSDIISLDPYIKDLLLLFYFKKILPYFYYRLFPFVYQSFDRKIGKQRKKLWKKSRFEKLLSFSLYRAKSLILKLIEKKKNEIAA